MTDWTVGPDGRSNTSDAFMEAVREVERLIRDEAHTLIGGHADMTARLIVATLAHTLGFGPRGVGVDDWPLVHNAMEAAHIPCTGTHIMRLAECQLLAAALAEEEAKVHG